MQISKDELKLNRREDLMKNKSNNKKKLNESSSALKFHTYPAYESRFFFEWEEGIEKKYNHLLWRCPIKKKRCTFLISYLCVWIRSNWPTLNELEMNRVPTCTREWANYSSETVAAEPRRERLKKTTAVTFYKETGCLQLELRSLCVRKWCITGRRGIMTFASLKQCKLFWSSTWSLHLKMCSGNIHFSFFNGRSIWLQRDGKFKALNVVLRRS